jgi:hypothetical protein
LASCRSRRWRWIIVTSFALPLLVLPFVASDTLVRDGPLLTGQTLLGRRTVVLGQRRPWAAHIEV